jgi:hypothetical protein
VIDLKDIPALLQPVIDFKKKALKNKDHSEPFEGYREFCSWKNAITNHTVKGKKAVEMLQTKAPNQSDQELAYVVANYKQITLPVSFEFQSTIGRGLHDSNWSIQYGEDASEYIDSDMTFKKYLEEDICNETPLRMSYDSWMKFVLPTIKINDSMGVVAFKPYREERQIEVDGEMVIAGDSLPEPMPFYYSCERVLNPLEWGYALIETNNYSMVDKAGRKVREGIVLELYDEENIYIIEQVGKSHEYTFNIRLYFNHNLGFLPVTYLLGQPVYQYNGSLAWQSPFLLVSDILDEVLLDGCNLRSVKAASVYPQKAMIGNECQFKDPDTYAPCVNGSIINADNKGFHQCPSCLGTGMTQRTSPLNTILVKTGSPDGITPGENIKPSDALAYISPSTETPAFLRQEITEGLMNAMSILHLKTTNTVAQPSATDTTATGMVMDEKGKYAFIKSVVDQIFEIYEFGMKCIGMMRYGSDFTVPTVQRPISYDFNSEGDYLMQISAAQAAGAPPVIISSYVYKYLKAIFYDNPKTAKAYDLIIASDRIFTMTKDQIMQEVARNLIQNWEVVLHDSAMTFVADLVRENPNFLDQDMQIMIDALVQKAKDNTPESVSVAPRLSPQSILANANA